MTTAHSEAPTAPLLRIRPDGTPEMLVAGTLADGARYEASAEAARAWAATLALRAKARRRVVQLELWERKVA